MLRYYEGCEFLLNGGSAGGIPDFDVLPWGAKIV